MKKWMMLIFIFLSFGRIAVYAQGLNFGWNIGNVRIYHDSIKTGINYDIDIGQFYFIKNWFSVGLNVLTLDGILDEDANRYLILPLEIAFLPFNYKNNIFLSIYGKTGWLLTHHTNDNLFNNGLYGAVGMKFFVFPEIIYRYCFHASVFVEYDTNNKLKFGVSIDAATTALVCFGFLIGMGNSELDRYRQQNPAYGGPGWY